MTGDGVSDEQPSERERRLERALRLARAALVRQVEIDRSTIDVSFPWLAVNAMAVYRLTVLIGRDSITQPIRDRASERMTLFLTCPWCTSIWIAGGVVVLTRFYPTEWRYPAVALALSGAAGFLAERG